MSAKQKSLAKGDFDAIGEERRTTDLVVNAIRERVVSGVLPAGERVAQDDLAAELNVSRTPVREAILRLQEEGFLEIIPYRGTVVREISPRIVEEVYSLRIPLEGLAARAGAPHLSDDQIEQLGGFEREIETLDQLINNPSFVSLNREFHYTLYHASGWTELIRLIDPLFAHGQRFTMHYRAEESPTNIQAALKNEHGKVLDACRRRDGVAAEQAMRMHLVSACGLLLGKHTKFDSLELMPALLTNDELHLLRQQFE